LIEGGGGYLRACAQRERRWGRWRGAPPAAPSCPAQPAIFSPSLSPGSGSFTHSPLNKSMFDARHLHCTQWQADAVSFADEADQLCRPFLVFAGRARHQHALLLVPCLIMPRGMVEWAEEDGRRMGACSGMERGCRVLHHCLDRLGGELLGCHFDSWQISPHLLFANECLECLPNENFNVWEPTIPKRKANCQESASGRSQDHGSINSNVWNVCEVTERARLSATPNFNFEGVWKRFLAACGVGRVQEENDSRGR
jgi:hypothetical protein